MEAKYSPQSMAQIKDILSGKLTGREVELKGWIYRTRTLGGKVFVVLRDSTGVLQVAITKGEVPPARFEAATKALIESAVKVSGTVVADKRAPGGYEVRAKDFQVVSFEEKYTLTEDQSEEFLHEVRDMSVQSQR